MSARIDKIRAELVNDPAGKGYLAAIAAATPPTVRAKAESVHGLINAATETVNTPTISGADLWGMTGGVEFNGLTDAQKSLWVGLCGIDTHDPAGPIGNAVNGIFGAGPTKTAFDLAAVTSNSRGFIIGVGANVRLGWLEMAITQEGL